MALRVGGLKWVKMIYSFVIKAVIQFATQAVPADAARGRGIIKIGCPLRRTGVRVGWAEGSQRARKCESGIERYESGLDARLRRARVLSQARWCALWFRTKLGYFPLPCWAGQMKWNEMNEMLGRANGLCNCICILNVFYTDERNKHDGIPRTKEVVEWTWGLSLKTSPLPSAVSCWRQDGVKGWRLFSKWRKIDAKTIKWITSMLAQYFYRAIYRYRGLCKLAVTLEALKYFIQTLFFLNL